MKNKHLVLLFAAALVFGLLLRGMPWGGSRLFETDLIKIDTSAVRQLVITLPEAAELSLERTEQGWAATQENRSVPVPVRVIQAMVASLAAIRSFSLVKSSLIDTMGLLERDAIRLDLWQGSKPPEALWIGKSGVQNGHPVTYLRIGNHDEIYLVGGDLHRLFDKTIADFRKNTVSEFKPNDVQSIRFEWPNCRPVVLVRRDSNGFWQTASNDQASLPIDSVEQWLGMFQLLNTCPFADHFDGDAAIGSKMARITLYAGSNELRFVFFHVPRPYLPEEYAEYRKSPQILATYFLHTSQNPDNYFALPDTLLARRICFGLLAPHS
jgi:hypothetical protein